MTAYLQHNRIPINPIEDPVSGRDWLVASGLGGASGWAPREVGNDVFLPDVSLGILDGVLGDLTSNLRPHLNG